MRERKRSRAERARAAIRSKRRVILGFTIGLAILGVLSVVIFGRAGFEGAAWAALGVIVGALYLVFGEVVERAHDRMNNALLAVESLAEPWASYAAIAVLLWLAAGAVWKMWFR